MILCTRVLVVALFILTIFQLRIIIIQDDSITKFSMANATLLNCYIQQRKLCGDNISSYKEI